MESTTKPMASTPVTIADIPAASPYYDRLRSLNIELDFVPYGSPEWDYLNGQIQEMEKRAANHIGRL